MSRLPCLMLMETHTISTLLYSAVLNCWTYFRCVVVCSSSSVWVSPLYCLIFLFHGLLLVFLSRAGLCRQNLHIILQLDNVLFSPLQLLRVGLTLSLQLPITLPQSSDHILISWQTQSDIRRCLGDSRYRSVILTQRVRLWGHTTYKEWIT